MNRSARSAVCFAPRRQPPRSCLGAGASLAEEGVNTGYFDNVAILGYDPVAYFTDGRAVKVRPRSASPGSAPPGISPAPRIATPSYPSR